MGSSLTRGFTGADPSAAGGGITEGQHEVLDTLTHALSEDAYTELIYTGEDLTSVITWTSVAKTLKIRDATLSYTGKDLTGVIVQQYDDLGSVVTTLTKTLGYTGTDLTSVTVVRT